MNLLQTEHTERFWCVLLIPFNGLFELVELYGHFDKNKYIVHAVGSN